MSRRHIWSVMCVTHSCEVISGDPKVTSSGRLAWTIEKLGFLQLKPEHSRSATEGVFENIRVIRAGTTVEVTNFAGAGPLELWDIRRAIQGVAGDMEAQERSRINTCPKRLPVVGDNRPSGK